jgi:uncharacterized phage-like protein YoqJ
MKTLITGHRLFKLENYDPEGIKLALKVIIRKHLIQHGFMRGYSGMASGVDLWFLDILIEESKMAKQHPQYVACIPFEGQEDTMKEDERLQRQELIDGASEVLKIKNSRMIDITDDAIVVWDGNKGGTHNVFQQLVEQDRRFTWINPINERIYNI